MTEEATEFIGVAPGRRQRDPDPPPVIIDLSHRYRRPAAPPAGDETSTLPLAMAAPPVDGPPIGQRPGPTGHPPAVSTDYEPTLVIQVGSAPATTEPIPSEPTTPAPVEPGTVSLESPLDPATVVLHPPVAGETSDVEPLTLAGRTVAAAPVRRFRGRARVHPRVRRRPQSAEVTPHRRRLPRSILRKWEAVAWIAAVGVVATMVGFVVRSAPATAPFVPAQPSAAPMAGRPSPQCFIAGCTTSYPAGPPTRVTIPSIGVDSTLEALVLDSHSELIPPVSYLKAGWWAGGPVPGDRGPAIIAGHVDSNHGVGVFFKLHTLQANAQISVLRGGVWVRFKVTRVEQYPKDQFPSAKVYQATPDAELRVITCGGDFDNVHKRYYDNIVVYAVLE